tara:strand:+ start:510 stop:1175 length:666 start_codon:yes stop_codon:yes gene_type:complete
MFLYNKTTEIKPNKGWTDVNGIQHPPNWNIWSDVHKASMNIEEIILDTRPDGRFHNWIDNGIGGVFNITDKLLDDANRQAQAKDSDGEDIWLDKDNKEVLGKDIKVGENKNYTAKMEDYKDAEGNVVVKKGIRPSYIQQVKKQQASLLSHTDWAVVRKTDIGVAVPTKIATWRTAIRTKATAMEEAIAAASNMTAFKALFLVWDIDGNKTGILFDWPELEE